MRYANRFLRLAACCVSCAALLVATAPGVSAQAGSRSKKFLTRPLLIEDQGSFFIGGVPKVTNYAASPTAGNPAQVMIGQMYVQFQIPVKKQRGSWPVIMVHGSTHTGACLESTPDGREGWAPYFVRKGLSVYVVDQAGRGRSGFDQSVLHEGEGLIASGDVTGGTALIPSFGRITDNGAWTAWFGHLVPDGSTILTGTLIRHGDPGDPVTDDGLHNDGYHPAYPIGTVDPNVVARVGGIGPAPAGPNSHFALEYYKQLVPNGEVTLPGSTCSTCVPTEISPANTWTPRALAELVVRLGGAIVATHSQSGNMGHQMARILREKGHLDKLKALITIEGGCSLPGAGLTGGDFDNIPYLAVSGDYRTDAQEQVCVDAIAAINASTTRTATPADFIELDELGDPTFDGTTHMMMLGTNNLEVADVILNWVRENVTRNRSRDRDDDDDRESNE